MGLVRNPLPMNLLNVLMLMVIIQPFIGFASSVNASLPLPEWSTALDRQAEELTGLMLQTTGVGDFSANLLVAAALPAIGEELLFRGFLQNLLRRVLKNPHVAIFTTAFIFSAIHLQFQGFIPRLLLGALLGYLYYWSGSLWLSCAAHFANNALAVCAYYYVAVKQIPVTPESIDATLQSGGWLAALSVMVSALMLMRIYQMERISRMKQRRTP